MRECEGPNCGNIITCVDDDFESTWFEIRTSPEDTICVCKKCYEQWEEEQESIMREAYRDYLLHKEIEQAKLDGVWKGA